MFRWFALTATHAIALVIGIALGIYLLPILTAPTSPDTATLSRMAQSATFTAQFAEDLSGNDFLHWGRGSVSVGPRQIVHQGKLAPGPDYKLYLVETFVENEDQFLAVKDRSPRIADVKTFSGFAVDVPDDIDVADYTTVLIWCEAFGEFIAAAKYQ
ncbi:MAG: DM13 domain-containing protein [Pseudomonadota bacterium]